MWDLNGLPITEFLARVDTLEAKTIRIGKYKRGNSSTGSVSHIKKHDGKLDNS